jgi:hypothetical protein
MAKKNSTDECGVGSRIRVKPGTLVPESPGVSCAGWTGTVVEATGKKPNVKLVIEWDEATVAAMPPDYVRACEEAGLYHRMACLEASSVEPGG